MLHNQILDSGRIEDWPVDSPRGVLTRYQHTPDAIWPFYNLTRSCNGDETRELDLGFAIAVKQAWDLKQPYFKWVYFEWLLLYQVSWLN